mmetsp:Transcript_37932/g.73456  ORF Transcript_37932/g.73456 Transcript_37932/m.73456 type:complete len:95 (+) Transcript_37932:2403-2687(+)
MRIHFQNRSVDCSRIDPNLTFVAFDGQHPRGSSEENVTTVDDQALRMQFLGRRVDAVLEEPSMFLPNWNEDGQAEKMAGLAVRSVVAWNPFEAT